MKIAEINIKRARYCRGSADPLVGSPTKGRNNNNGERVSRPNGHAKLRRFDITKVGVDRAFRCRVAHYRSRYIFYEAGRSREYTSATSPREEKQYR